MKKLYFLLCIFIVNLLLFFPLYGKESKYFTDAKKLYQEKNFEDSKFLFEKDIVFNPKNEISYLYLAKIFEEKEDEVYEELNLNTVLLLNPKNEEAIYMLMQLKIKQSNFSATKELLKKFNLVCVSICSKNKKIEKKLESLSP
tara:strand:+ start:69 stop:497 length:429 start_codon:yes stop_codon:yes gene_type:complete